MDEIDKFLETYNFPKFNQEESENLDRQITTSEIESVIKKLPTNKSTGLNSFIGEFYQTFKEQLTPMFLKLLKKRITQEEGRLPRSLYKANIILIPNSHEYTTKKENYRPISPMNIDAKILNKILANWIP